MASRFNKKSTAEQVSLGVDLFGKNALVTGANTGLGLETTRVLALRGANVTMACRDLRKADAARQAILGESVGAIEEEQLDVLQLDLNSLEKTRAAALEYCNRGTPLHLLINNAGIMIPMKRITEDGFEGHLGINHLAHFLFTNLLLDPLKAANGARVVVLSSAAMAFATLNETLEDINWEARKYKGFASYGDSKLMNHLFARELTRRYSDEGIVANALHPGVIGTELGRDQSLPFMLVGIVAMPFMKTIPQGAATTVLVATADAYAKKGGLYFKDCRESKPQHKHAGSDALAEKLWQRSIELTGL